MVFTCCCYITWDFQQGDEKKQLPSLARLVVQIPGSPSWPAAYVPVINFPTLLKAEGEKDVYGFKKKVLAGAGLGAPRRLSPLAGSHVAVIPFVNLKC